MKMVSLALLLQLSTFQAPSAVDHVVHLEKLDQNGETNNERSILYRSGSSVRVESTSPLSGWNTYADLTRGLEVSVQRGPDNSVQRVTIGTPHLQSRRLPATGRRDQGLGENCLIWRLVRERSDTGNEICETADGILLWQAFWYPRPTDRTHLYMRATALERRPVRPEEVRPPRGLLALASEASPPTVSTGTEPPDHEVEMVGDEPEDGSYVFRIHGAHFSEERRTPDEYSIRVGNGAVSSSYTHDEEGRPLSLEISRVGYYPLRQVVPRWVPVAGRAPEQLLGESCTWQDNAAIMSNDLHYLCRTADGITLKTESWFHWTNRTQRFTARRLSRAPLSNADFNLPPRALDWTHWGITPAP